MGCGKSTLGKLLASKLNVPFVDLDEYIVEREKMSIPQIFEQYGEPHFRELEAKYICELKDSYVVATGGGAILNDKTADFANENGLVIFIDVPFRTCYERIEGDENRPLVMKNTKEQLEDLFNSRRKIYVANSSVTLRAAADNEKNIEALLELVEK